MRVPELAKNGFDSGFACFSRVRGDKIPQEVKNRHEAQSRPWVMKGEQKPF
jgi:hypothetical protein